MCRPRLTYSLLMCMALIVSCLRVSANDTLRMSDDEVRRWFLENEIRDTVPPDTLAPPSVPDSIQMVLSAADSLWLPLITTDELAQIRAHAVERAACNPLFIDEWVVSTGAAGEQHHDEITELRRRAKQAVFRDNPDVYVYHESQLPNIDEIKRRRVKAEKNQITVDAIPTIKIDKLTKIKPAKSPWTFGGDAQVQFSQNYYSDNWYTGGESSLAAYFFFKGKVNYSSQKIQWDSQLDAKFSFNTAASDTLRKIRTNDDLVRLTSKLGVQAFKSDKWFYSADFELSTTLFNTYVKNTYERVTGPASPLRLYLSLGLDFKYKKELSVQMLPFSYKMLHVADTAKHVGVTQSIADKQGIPPGQKTKNDVGSKLKVRWEHSFMREIKLETTFSLYTNYRGVEVDWEVIGYFIINRFLSARVALNPRYDSTVELPDGEDPRLQFKELVSVGFHYKF